METQTTKKDEWYKKPFGVVLMLLLFFPIGLYLMWKYTNWNSRVKWGITGFFGLMIVIEGVVSNFQTSSQTNPVATGQSPSSEATTTPSPTPVKQLDLKVTNLVVKKINMDQCRYFFNIKNGEPNNFSGKVGVALHKLDSVWPEDGSEVQIDQLEPNLYKVFYLDSSLCPNTVEKGGAATFSYTVEDVNGNKVFGEDQIPVTNQFEDDTISY
ncbi:MAG: hypothetical protein ABSC49_02745 [Candidatus Microgenomates bacterium]|jgi:hypothetical protein